MLACEALELVVVDCLGHFCHAIGDEIVSLAGKIQRMSVRQVAAVRQVHSQHGVARLQRRHIDGDVRLCARVRLDVGMLGAEERLRAVNGELLGLIHEFAAAVVALARVALGIFVREHRAHRFHHRFGNEILGWDQLQAGGLAADLVAEDRCNGRINFFE